MPRCEGFPFVARPDVRVLVLGSMPGVASLRAGQYYAHPRNAFWPIVFSLWDEPCALEYTARLEFAGVHHIALWDAAHACEREGSLDTAIRNAEPNDFKSLLTFAPGIHTVICNGGAAYTLFSKSPFGKACGLRVYGLPSTSPAHTLSFETKRAAWQILRSAAEEGTP